MGHLDVAVRCESHIGGKVEIVVTRAGHTLPAELHDHAPARVHLDNHVTADVDDPDVALRVDPHRVCAARIACRSGRYQSVGGSVRPGRPGDHPVAPGAHKFPATFEFHDRVRAAM